MMDSFMVDFVKDVNRWITHAYDLSILVIACVQGEEAKLGIFQNNNKRLNYKLRLILILKNKHQNKKIDSKQ